MLSETTPMLRGVLGAASEAVHGIGAEGCGGFVMRITRYLSAIHRLQVTCERSMWLAIWPV